MKKYLLGFAAAIILVSAACGNTTKESEEFNTHNPAADSAVGNSAAANDIYRDSADIRHATESGGGTGNPSIKDGETPGQIKADSGR